MPKKTRRDFLSTCGAALAGAASASWPALDSQAQQPGERPNRPDDIRVLNPQMRVPLSFIIDDSTCLVNLAHFAIPQFAQVFPDRYRQPWRKLPREIPDDFVRKFRDWCGEHQVKGKYSIVPHPACVGWLDRELPGWSRRDLQQSLRLVRDTMLDDWDIHPEMVSHTWVINTKTGRPYEEKSQYYMENWRWTDGKSVDQLTDYLSYALRILKNVELPCEGITTPGGFGNRVLPELSQATLQSCRDVFSAEIPHYFRHLYTDERSVAPRVEYASGLGGDDPRCAVSIIGCTGDWFGGWDGLTPGSADRFISADLQQGRLVDVIDRKEPTCLVCHWPGIYYNGDELGFNIFKTVVERLEERYDHLIWMRLSEIARYWAAKELTAIERNGQSIALTAPFACPAFTLTVSSAVAEDVAVRVGNRMTPLRSVDKAAQLQPGTYLNDRPAVTLCFDLSKGRSTISGLRNR